MTYTTLRPALLLLLLAWLSACATLRTERVVNFEESIPASDLETIVLKNPTGFNLSDSRFHMQLGQYKANNVDVSGWVKTKSGPISRSIENDILDRFLITGKLRLDFRLVEIQEKSLIETADRLPRITSNQHAASRQQRHILHRSTEWQIPKLIVMQP